MKRQKIEAVLRHKVRLKITKRKRGKFTVRIPALLFPGYDGRTYDVEETFTRKRDALTFLYTKLRLIGEITIAVYQRPELKKLSRNLGVSARTLRWFEKKQIIYPRQ